MTISLIDAMRTKDSRTENGMITNSSTLNGCLDLFFTIGAMRGQDVNRLISKFSFAFNENPLTALRILFWARDARQGAGERKIFRDILKYLANEHANILRKNIQHIPMYGRWDDILSLFNTQLDLDAKKLIETALLANDGLCAKWMPRKGKDAIALERYMKMSPKQYRKFLVERTKVVETNMCNKDWSSIEYEKVPSLAMTRYTAAFLKNDTDRFNVYKNDDNVKVNVGAIYPYDITKALYFGGDKVLLQKQWDSLPNYMLNNKERVLPLCDVSDSMTSSAGGNKNLTCMDVCISLGLYISERNEGAFKNAFITFSSSPKLQYLNGSLSDRLSQLRRADWGMNTNLNAVFDLILNTAISNKLSNDELPTTVLIMSDMEFDRACNMTSYEMIVDKYNKAGYTIPKIVFWNIQSRKGDNYPVQATENNTALIGGFSPSILKSVLSGEEMNPILIMNKTVNSERYQPITI